LKNINNNNTVDNSQFIETIQTNSTILNLQEEKKKYYYRILYIIIATSVLFTSLAYYEELTLWFELLDDFDHLVEDIVDARDEAPEIIKDFVIDYLNSFVDLF
jgi:hypothetical protein